MSPSTTQHFKAKLQIIGINPFVEVPESVLQTLFIEAQKDKGPIPIRGKVNGKPFQQTLVRYRGLWRLYVNTLMLKDSPKRIGETLEFSVAFDPKDRTLTPPLKFLEALEGNPNAKEAFDNLRPHLQKEIIRYLLMLKRESSLTENIVRAIGFLEGKNQFVGREPHNTIKHQTTLL